MEEEKSVKVEMEKLLLKLIDKLSAEIVAPSKDTDYITVYSAAIQRIKAVM